MEKNHFEQARFWLAGAGYVANLESDNSNKYNVAVAMTIHSIIKANDALTFKFMNITARRHDDAARLYQDLIKKNLIKAEYSLYSSIIQEAISNKAKADYRGSYFSKNDFEDFKRKADKFLKMVEEIV